MTVFIFLGSLLAAMALGVPIAYSLLLSGVALMWHLDLFDAQILAQNVINGADSFPLLAVPFFMLAGEIMNVGGLSKRIVNLALTLVGHVRGGLDRFCDSSSSASIFSCSRVFSKFVRNTSYCCFGLPSASSSKYETTTH